MKRIIYPAIASIAALASVGAANAQSAVDAMQITQNDFKGTARFMSMGGAFTALGGDLSAVGLNPAGIGVYRSSEIGATLDIDIQKSSAKWGGSKMSDNQTKAYCNNFGYVGTVVLNQTLQTISWGVTYNRQVSFDRVVGAYAYPVGTSLTNYIASFTNGTPADGMIFDKSYNPYLNSDYDWLSILAYNSYLINPVNGSSNRYQGLFVPGTTESDAILNVQEKGYVDNYEFTLGGNINNVFFWGLGIGVNDLRYVRNTYYSESMDGASVYSETSSSGVTPGKAEYSLYNSKLINGTGWNLSFGIILKPIQELRLGASIKSPTWYKLDQSLTADLDYDITPDRGQALSGSEYTDEAFFSWKLRSPWRFNVGAAAVLGNVAIVSVDYERQMYNDMDIKTAYYDNWGYITGYEKATWLNDNIREYTQASNNFRIGFEGRVTPKFSVRLGYNVQMTNVNSEVADGKGEVLTAGTDPSFSLDKTTNYISGGVGYRFSNFYLDATYMHKTAKSTLHPYTSYGNTEAPFFDVTENNNSIVVSLGFKF